MKTQTNIINKLWIGIDFHNKTWRIHFRSDSFSGNPFNMIPDADALRRKVVSEYNDYQVKIAKNC